MKALPLVLFCLFIGCHKNTPEPTPEKPKPLTESERIMEVWKHAVSLHIDDTTTVDNLISALGPPEKQENTVNDGEPWSYYVWGIFDAEDVDRIPNTVFVFSVNFDSKGLIRYSLNQPFFFEGATPRIKQVMRGRRDFTDNKTIVHIKYNR